MPKLEHEKYSIHQVRAAKRRTVMRTAVRPPPAKAVSRGSYRKGILIALVTLVVLSLAGLAAGKRAWTAAFDEAASLYQTGTQEPAAPLAFDEELQKLMSLFQPPLPHEWAELEATANLRRTGNTRARKSTRQNAEFLERFRRTFDTSPSNVSELYGRGRALLNRRYDLRKLREMLITTSAMAHFLLDSGKMIRGRSVLFAVLRAGQTVALGVGGGPTLQSLEVGQRAASTARLLLISHAYSGSLSIPELEQLGTRLRATLPLEPDLRRSLIGSRDRALEVIGRVRTGLGFWWSVVGYADFEDPEKTLTRIYRDCLEAAVLSPKLARDEFQEILASLDGSRVHQLARMGAPSKGLYDRLLRAKTVALGAVTAAEVLHRLSRSRILPPELGTHAFGLPRDPVNDRIFRYEAMGESFRLYGVGPDGEDNGGSELHDVLLLGPGRS